MILDPKEAKGVLLHENDPSKASHAESFGLNRYGRSRFKFIYACGSSLHQRNKEKSGYTPQRIEMKWFLKVLMVLSAAFALWRFGGTNWKINFSVFM